MKDIFFRLIVFVLVAVAAVSYSQEMVLYDQEETLDWYLPISTPNRQSLENLRITAIGKFGRLRKARPKIKAHLHTGVDLKRPHTNYIDEPVFPAAEGVVISIRDDGPYAQIIIEHTLPNSETLWTVYEHISGIRTRLHEAVDPFRPIARFMNKDELNTYGWHFDHIHFEVMKVRPLTITPDRERPFRHFGTYCLVCYTTADLEAKYYDPFEFLKQRWEPY